MNENNLLLSSDVRILYKLPNHKYKVLLLTDQQKQDELIKPLSDSACAIWATEKPVSTLSGYDLVVSFGYRHILTSEILKSAQSPIINLHISLLPWNRGAHPNFWAFYDGSPHGVTIHLIDSGIDTGAIIAQKEVSFFDNEDTFEKTYYRLIAEMVGLFSEKISQILEGSFSTTSQPLGGSFHRASELPKDFNGWSSDIEVELKRLRSIDQTVK